MNPNTIWRWVQPYAPQLKKELRWNQSYSGSTWRGDETCVRVKSAWKWLLRAIDRTGRISKVGDAMVRTALYEAANVMLTRAGKFSTLKRWALEVAKRRGMRRAKVALARKLATVLHRLWVEGSEFRFGKETAAA